jgi:hypothetical protein
MSAEFVTELTRAYRSVREVWLIGSRANDSARPDSDWDYIAFADTDTLAAVRADTHLSRPNIDLLVVHDGDNFVSPWSRKRGSLSGWEWEPATPDLAHYRGTKEKPGGAFDIIVSRNRARRLWPQIADATPLRPPVSSSRSSSVFKTMIQNPLGTAAFGGAFILVALVLVQLLGADVVQKCPWSLRRRIISRNRQATMAATQRQTPAT